MEYSVSTLKTNTIQAATGTTLNVASGHVLTQPGSIVQTVSGSTSTYTNIASTSFADTTLTATITPKFSTSKIMIIISQNLGTDRDNNSVFGSLQLMRDSTVIQTQTYIGAIEAGGSSAVKSIVSHAITHLDSPSTTSATVYKTQAKVTTTSNNAVMRCQWDNGVSHITLMEIAQ